MDHANRFGNNPNARHALKALAASLMLAFGSLAHALPAGGAVAAGSASIASGAGSMTINQSSQNVAINWQSFSIGAAEAVRFVQPNASSVALNRVLGSDPSSILGSLSANGKVFLVNPSGILFARGAQVNVGGLIASTRNISDTDFMAGNYKFAGTGSGTVVNQGTINAGGGYVAMLGANVSNEGVISARLGSVVLAGGNAMTLDVAGDGLLSVAVNEGAVNALVRNGGLIQADGGQVMLTAMSAGTLLQSAVNNTGLIQAQTVENHNGTIRLLGDMQSGTVSVGGTLDASGMGAGQTGGSVTVTGHHVGLFSGNINASGDAGGGTVLVGGGFQGRDPAVQNAAATYMSADSTITADAGTKGNGGTVVLWGNDSTRGYGSIAARGGAQGGDGGLIETSAHWLDVWGVKVDASAPNGNPGTWLLDPADVTIGLLSDGAATNTASVFSPNPGVNTATIGTADLRNALEAGGGTNITITTTNTGGAGSPPSGLGNITVASALTWVIGVGRSATLTLNAAGDVNIDAPISITRGNLVVCCGRDVNVREAITVATASGGGGSVLLSAGRDVRIERTIASPLTDITVTDGNITICAGRDVLLRNLFDAPAALMTLTNSTIDPLLTLGLAPGLVLSAGNAGNGPGVAGGTVIFSPLTKIAVTRSAAPPLDVTVNYNPVSYALADRTDYAPLFTLVGIPGVNERMLVFPDGANKAFDGTTTATFTGLKGIPAGVDVTLLNAGGIANFENSAVGANKVVNFDNGFSLGGADAGLFSFAATCCGPAGFRTTASITAATTALSTSSATAPPVLPALLAPLAGLDLGLGGIAMPPIVVAEIPPVETGAVATAVEAPPAEAAPVPVPVPPTITRRKYRN